MSRFHVFSISLHVLLFAAIFISGRAHFKPIPKIDVIKVSLAPLPQPKIIQEETPTEIEAPVEEKVEEKTPPKKEAEKTEPAKKPPEKKAKEVVKRGLPDIKPKVYTGSGRGFTYSYYLNILLNKIGKNWTNPFKGKNVVMKSIIYFEVDKNGHIYGVRLEEDSGNNLYNETAMRAVIVTKKLPPLPDEFADDYLKVHLEFLTAQ
ncbi:MAG: TonB C-terminal domain-containing protein [candidate division WOR-3 bacterium]|jgi:TonB family protein